MDNQKPKTLSEKFFAIKQFCKFVLWKFFMLIIVLTILYFYFPIQITFVLGDRIELLSTSFFVYFSILYYFRKSSQWISEDVESDVIEIKKCNPTAEQRKRAFNRQYRTQDRFTEEESVKLDLLKSFSPIPIILFILAFFQNTYPDIYDLYNEFNFSLIFVTENFFILAILVFILAYMWFVFAAWSNYKMHNQKRYKYLIELENAQDSKGESTEQQKSRYFSESEETEEEKNNLSMPLASLKELNKDKSSP